MMVAQYTKDLTMENLVQEPLLLIWMISFIPTMDALSYTK